VPIHFYGKFYLYHNMTRNAFHQTDCCDGRRNVGGQFISFLQQNLSANDGNSSSAQSRGARRRELFHAASTISRRISQNPSWVT